MTLDIAIDADAEWDSSKDWAALARSAAIAAIAESAFPQLGQGSDAEVRALNKAWRGKDEATNVLSFPMAEDDELESPAGDGPELMLGDIILARGICAAEAMEKGVELESHAAHLMVHGTLHLLGYDHMDDDSAADMECREIRALARLGIADPYAESL
jgi:probable rRNA maturation factor